MFTSQKECKGQEPAARRTSGPELIRAPFIPAVFLLAVTMTVNCQMAPHSKKTPAVGERILFQSGTADIESLASRGNKGFAFCYSRYLGLSDDHIKGKVRSISLPTMATSVWPSDHGYFVCLVDGRIGHIGGSNEQPQWVMSPGSSAMPASNVLSRGPGLSMWLSYDRCLLLETKTTQAAPKLIYKATSKVARCLAQSDRFAFIGTGDLMPDGGSDELVCVDMLDGKIAWRIDTHDIRQLKVSGDSLLGITYGSMFVKDIRSGVTLAHFDYDVSDIADALAVSPDAKTVALAYGGEIQFFSLPRLVKARESIPFGCKSMSWADNETILAIPFGQRDAIVSIPVQSPSD